MPRRPPGIDPTRGRHRKAVSRETKVWHEEHAPPSDPPGWMSVETFEKLTRLRRELEGRA